MSGVRQIEGQEVWIQTDKGAFISNNQLGTAVTNNRPPSKLLDMPNVGMLVPSYFTTGSNNNLTVGATNSLTNMFPSITTQNAVNTALTNLPTTTNPWTFGYVVPTLTTTSGNTFTINTGGATNVPFINGRLIVRLTNWGATGANNPSAGYAAMNLNVQLAYSDENSTITTSNDVQVNAINLSSSAPVNGGNTAISFPFKFFPQASAAPVNRTFVIVLTNPNAVQLVFGRIFCDIYFDSILS